jgi:MFS superfamily sulfate permease-like transporter
LGIALASGVPLYAGIISGIIGGVIVSLMSGSALSVSGPAAGLTTVIAGAIAILGSYQSLLLAVIIAGIFQLLLGILKLATIANYFPSSVIKGMLAAIDIMLIVKQIPVALGYDSPDFWSSGFLSFFQTKHVADRIRFFNEHTARGAIIITVVSIGIMALMQQNFAKRWKIIPAPLLVVVVAVLINLVFMKVAVTDSLKATQLVNIPSNIFSSISFPDFSKLFSSVEILKQGLLIGLLATLETLLCVEAIDKLDKRNRITPANKELVAQGVGNMLCGIFGAIPITAVIVRGWANVDVAVEQSFLLLHIDYFYCSVITASKTSVLLASFISAVVAF